MKKFVRVSSRVDCDYTGLEEPVYRLYVNDELMSERTWRWQDRYLSEELQILAEPGVYTLRYELVNSDNAVLTVGTLTKTAGMAVNDVAVIDNEHFEIL